MWYLIVLIPDFCTLTYFYHTLFSKKIILIPEVAYVIFFAEDWSADEDQATAKNPEEIEKRLKPDVDSKLDQENHEIPKTVKSTSADHSDNTVATLKGDQTNVQSNTPENVKSDTERTKIEISETQSDTVAMKEAEIISNSALNQSGERDNESDEITGEEVEQKDSVTIPEKDSGVVKESSWESDDAKTCDNEKKVVKDEIDLKTKVKGDMVVVGTERISPSSDLSSGNKGM